MPDGPIAMVVPNGLVAAGAGSMTAVVRIVVTVPIGSVAAGADSMAAVVRIVVAATGSAATLTAVRADTIYFFLSFLHHVSLSSSAERV